MLRFDRSFAVRMAASLALLLGGPLPGQEVRVLPGDASLQGALLREGAASYRWLMVREGSEQPVGSLTDVLSRTDWNGTPALLRVLTVQQGGRVLIDSTVTRLADLAPLRHRSHQPHRSIDLRFEAGTVRGVVTPAGGEPRAIEAASPVPFFDSGSWDLVLRALPLAPGRRLSLSVYDQDNGGQIWYSARVVGLEEDAWRVEARLGRTTATLWIDAETRELRRMEMQAGPGVRLRQVRAE